MYHKFIGEREVFSNCRAIELNDTLICNPSLEQIHEAGWLEYIPPQPEYHPQLEPNESDIVIAVKKMLKTDTDDLTDEEALEVAAAYPTWASRIGTTVFVNNRLWYDGHLYKVVQEHIASEQWSPSITPSLFREVSIEEIPEWSQPLDAEDAYHIGDRVRHNEQIWESLVDSNVWEPSETVPTLWKLIVL